jgi:hypothetical protein
MFLNFQSPSDKFNAWHLMGGEGNPVTTWSNPEDIVMLIRNDIRAYLDVNVLAESFNVDKASLLGNIISVDNFDILDDDGNKVFDGSAIVGIIADKSWFKIKTQDMFLDVDYNPNNRTYQYYLNNIKQYQYSLFANGVILATSVPDVDITKVEFPVSSATLTAGTTERFQLSTTPPQGNDTITYAISAEKDGEGDSATAGSIATVAAASNDPKACIVTAKAAGTATLTATANGHSDTISLTITAAS